MLTLPIQERCRYLSPDLSVVVITLLSLMITISIHYNPLRRVFIGKICAVVSPAPAANVAAQRLSLNVVSTAQKIVSLHANTPPETVDP